MRLKNRSTDPLMSTGCDGWPDGGEKAMNPYQNTSNSAQPLRVWVNRVYDLAKDGNTLACRATSSQNITIAGGDAVQTGDDIIAIRTKIADVFYPSLMVPAGATVTVSERCALPNREADIALLVGCACFTALTAPYGGGVFFPALTVFSAVLLWRWSHEGQESMPRPESAQSACHVGWNLAYGHQGRWRVANRLHERRCRTPGGRLYRWNAGRRTSGRGILRFRGQPVLGRRRVESRSGVGAGRDGRMSDSPSRSSRMLRQGQRTLLTDGLGVAA